MTYPKPHSFNPYEVMEAAGMKRKPIPQEHVERAANSLADAIDNELYESYKSIAVSEETHVKEGDWQE
jgi:hypothetical protein